MSLIQSLVTAESIRIAVDTGAINFHMGASSVTEMSKMVHLPHAGVLFAYRGSALAFMQVFAQFFLTEGNDSFDAIETVMGQRVLNASAQFPAELSVEFSQIKVSYLNLFIAGYSARQDRMICTNFEIDLNLGTCTRLPPILCARCAPGFESVPDLDNDAGMLELARMQVEWMKEHHPDLATGGRLLIAEINRDSALIRDVGLIEVFAK